jgi:hypothetical protein
VNKTSAAVRDPHVQEIVQINKQNPGVMILSLMMILLVMGGALMYRVEGGGDPIQMLFNGDLNHRPKHFNSKKFSNLNGTRKKFSNLNGTRRNNNNNFSKRKSNTRSNHTRRSNNGSYAKIEDFDKLSLVSFYHFLRFHAFPGVSSEDKKEMLKKAAMVPLQREDVFKQIEMAVQQNKFDQMMGILEENQLDLGEVEVYQKIWNSILDAYFKEEEFPIELLQKLLKVGGNVEYFLERYHSSNQKTKEMMVMQTCITTSDYPEMML